MRTWLPFPMVLVAFALLAQPAVASKKPAFTKCTPPKAFPEAGGRFTSLSVAGAKCSTATSVANAWAKCAAANGKGGRCVKKVAGDWACSETATTSAGVRTSSVVCGKGSARVKLGATRTV